MGKPYLKTKPIKPRVYKPYQSQQEQSWSLTKRPTESEQPLIIISYYVIVGSSEAHKHDAIAHFVLYNVKTQVKEFEAFVKPASPVLDQCGIDFSNANPISVEEARERVMEVIRSRRIIGFNTRAQIKKLALPIPNAQICGLERTGAFSAEDGSFKSLEYLAAEYDMECVTEQQQSAVIAVLWSYVEKRWRREERLWWRKSAGKQ